MLPRYSHIKLLLDRKEVRMSFLETPVPGSSKAEGQQQPSRFSRLRFGRKITPYLFLSPFLVGYIIFLVYPLIYSLNLSLYRKKLIGGISFVGLSNYVKVFQDSNFWEGIRNVLVFGLIQIPIMLGLALIFALILDSAVIQRRTIFRLGFFLPFAVPSVVAALMWGYFYGQSFGPIAQIFTALKLTPPVFLTPKGILPAIANISTWQYTGYNMLIIYAALKAIPPEIYEAALVDGANNWQIAWNIRIPIIWPAITLTIIFSIIGTLQLFNEPNVLAVVAPTIVNLHFTPNIYLYNLAFRNAQFDYSAAMAFSLAIVSGILASLVLVILIVATLAPFFGRLYGLGYLIVVVIGVDFIIIESIHTLIVTGDPESMHRVSVWLKLAMPLGLFAVLLGKFGL
jgi:multiple sugar transport system permease protein